MKFIKLVAFLGLSFSNHAIAAIPEPWEDEDEQRPRLRGGFDTDFIDSRNSFHNPNNCPTPSQAQLTGNQCVGRRNRRTVCCTANGNVVWVQCSRKCVTPAKDSDHEDSDHEDYDFEDYDEVADALEED
eukprot:scaffold12339_cov114-Skeletonema_menzelii.AAC.1